MSKYMGHVFVFDSVCVCVFVCACVYKLEKVQCDPVRNGTGGLWYREMWIAGTAGFLQGHRVWPRPRWSRLMVLCKHLHTGCQYLSQRLIKTFHWNPCEVAKPPPLHKQPAAYFCTPQTQTVCVHTQGITHTNEERATWRPVSWNTMQATRMQGIAAWLG